MPLVTSPSDIRGFSQANQPAVVPEGGLWYDTSVDTLYVSDGSTFNTIGASSFAGAAVVSQSVTIGNYTTPTSAVVSSTSPSSGNFSDNLSSYSTQAAIDLVYVPTGSYMLGDIINDRINYYADSLITNHAIAKDLGASIISNTSWVLRFRYSMTAQSRNSSGYEQFPFIGFSSESQSVISTTNQNSICFVPYQDNVVRFYQVRASLNQNMNNITYSANSGEQATVGDNYYIELERSSTTSANIKIYSDSGYSVLVSSATVAISASITGLRYLVIKNASPNQNQTGSQTGWISNLVFTNGANFGNTNLFDDNTTTRWTSTSEINPNCYVDQASSLNFAGAAFFYDNTNTTATSMLIQTSSDGSTWTTKRTITTSNLVSGYNFYRFNIAMGVRYVRFYGNDAGAKILSLYEVKIYQRTEAQILNDLGILEIDSTDSTLNAAGT